MKPMVGLAFATASILFIGGALAAQAATASQIPKTDAQLVSPAVVVSDSSYYNEAQIDRVWTAVTAAYPAPLPSGYAFPARLDFFHPSDVANPLFQVGLPDMLAAQYWRCSWLDAHLNSASPISSTSLKAALDGYWSLPSVAAIDPRDRLSQTVLTEYASEEGLDNNYEALFALDCQGFEK